MLRVSSLRVLVNMGAVVVVPMWYKVSNSKLRIVC
jgi:hypothetical protein